MPPSSGGCVKTLDSVLFVEKIAERMDRNPRTGDFVAIPERNEIYFKPGKELRE